MIQKAFKYRLFPTAEQQVLLSKHFGCVRYIYNWALNCKIEAYRTEKKTENFVSLGNKLPTLKTEFDWLKEVNSQSLQSALKNVDNAFKRFFKEKKGFPRFKSKKRRQDSFHAPQFGEVDFDAGTVSIPKLKGIKAVIDRKFNGKIKTITISRTPSGRYFASVLVEVEGELPSKSTIQESSTVGIDVGLKTYATLSTGEKIDNPRCLRKSQKQLKYNQYILSKMDRMNKTKDGTNREEQRRKVARLHEKVRNQRDDFLHKLTHRLTHDNQVDTLVVEDLSVKNMMKNHCLAGSIGDAAWGKFFQFLNYKCEWYGKNLLTIGRFEPSSKMCSCGVVNSSLTLKDREWTCGACGASHDRDVLAANNIKHFGLLKQNKIGLEESKSTLVETVSIEASLKQETPML
jgi:putative transposase